MMCVLIELMQGQKIMLEYEKYNELLAKMTRLTEGFEDQIRALIKKEAEGSENLVAFYESQLQDLTDKNNLVCLFLFTLLT